MAISLVLFVLFVAYIHGGLPLHLVDQLERFSYDARVRLAMPGTIDPHIVVIDIDDKTLKEQGQWPLPRDKFAQMMDQLFTRYHAKLAAFDVTFAEADRSFDLSLLDQLASGPLKNDPVFVSEAGRIRPQIERDKIFAASLEHRPVVLGYVIYEQGQNKSASVGVLPVAAIPDVRSRYPLIEFPKAVSYTANLPVLASAAASQGYFADQPDEDGSFRRVSLLQEYDGNVYGSLDLAVLQILQNNAPVSLGFDPGGQDMGHMEDVVVGQAVIPVDDTMSALVPYRAGATKGFTYVSATDVIKGTAPAAMLKDAVVYVGTSAPGLQDLRNTPVGSVFPGVEIHANLLSGIFDGRVMNDHPQYRNGAETLLLLLVAVLITWVAIRKSVITGTVVTLAVD
ncbi:MAG TPA: CHASE2 domain-containing protein, partial [Gammaproteobacteria bacterium]